ncbi:hypothetical protein [Isoptericola sp. NPDC056134]|uniref:hypothetical protein n=1 Tax=Isoptericola sp. NPDC056134 TaxID=3345723 RepID=UPI0035E947E5
MKTRSLAATAALLTCTFTVAACGSSAGEDAAQTAYDACHKTEAKIDLLEIDGNQVSVVVAGENAKAMSGSDEEIAALSNGEVPDETEGPSAFAVSLAAVDSADCLAEHTGYPGSYDQLTDGEEWDGWRFEEETGAGSEFTSTFVATS